MGGAQRALEFDWSLNTSITKTAYWAHFFSQSLQAKEHKPQRYSSPWASNIYQDSLGVAQCLPVKEAKRQYTQHTAGSILCKQLHIQKIFLHSKEPLLVPPFILLSFF